MRNKKVIIQIIAFIAVIAITVYIYSIREKIEDFAVYGYPGIFLIALLSNATVLLPAPGIAIVFAMGAVFNPLGVGLAAGAGGALGELVGYLAGFSGQAVMANTNIYKKLTVWMERNGSLTVLALAAIPNPLFDLAGIAAGVLQMKLRRFLLWCWIGVTLKMLFFAYAGSESLQWLERIIN